MTCTKAQRSIDLMATVYFGSFRAGGNLLCEKALFPVFNQNVHTVRKILMIMSSCFEKGEGGWVWWLTVVISALWEAEVGELLEYRNSWLQGVMIATLHSSLGDRMRPCL